MTGFNSYSELLWKAMKKIILIASLIANNIAFTQIPTGVKFISGQIGYSNIKTHSGSSETKSLKIIPTFGYFFAPNWGIAGSFGYKKETIHTKQVLNSSAQQHFENSSAIVIIPSLRKFWVMDERLSIFGQMDFPLEFGKIKKESDQIPTTGETSDDYFSYGISVKPGIDYFLNRTWKIVATIGEISYTSNKKNINKETDTNLRLGFTFSSVNFGIKYILPRKIR